MEVTGNLSSQTDTEMDWNSYSSEWYLQNENVTLYQQLKNEEDIFFQNLNKTLIPLCLRRYNNDKERYMIVDYFIKKKTMNTLPVNHHLPNTQDIQNQQIQYLHKPPIVAYRRLNTNK